VVDTSGKVGIGTTAPGYLLHLVDGSAPALVLERTGVYAAKWQLNVSNEAGGDFSIADVGSGVAHRLLIDNTGKVGIGTNAPSALLQVGDSLTGGNNVLKIAGAKDSGQEVALEFLTGTNTRNWKIKVDASTAKFTIRDEQDSLDRLVIDGGGNVGIGTNTPGALLNISKGALTLTQAVNGNADELLIQDNASAGLSILTPNNETGWIVFGDTDDSSRGMIAYDHGTGLGAGADSMLFYANNGLKMVINSSGNVGIGTNAPAHKLEVAGGYIKIAGLDQGIGWGDVNTGVFGRGTANSGSYLQLRVNGGTGAIHIDSDSNVGFGTNTPSGAKVDIVAGDNSTPQIKLRAIGTNTQAVIHASGSSGNFRILTGDGDGNQTEKFTIGRTTGNVGIGTTSPDAKLDVNGTLRVGNDTRGHYLGEKAVTLNGTTYTTALTIVLSDHNAAHVKLFLTGDWNGHSAVAYVGEYFIQNGGGGYAEPGMIISEFDNTATDFIESKIVDPSTDTFTIQLKLSDSDNGTMTGQICYHAMGEVTSVT